jgi:hypothetical protein
LKVMPSLEEVDERLRSLGAEAIVSDEDVRAMARLDVMHFPAHQSVDSRAVPEGRPAGPRQRLARFVNRPVGLVAFVVVALITLLAFGGMFVAADAYLVASAPSTQISEKEAVADAKRGLPNNGADYKVVATELEPSSDHFNFTAPNGDGFGEDQVKECIIIPPLPPLPFLPCRNFPVWVVAFSGKTCDVVIAINALTGRFEGAGGGSAAGVQPTPGPLGNCGISPGQGPTTSPVWWQPIWN